MKTQVKNAQNAQNTTTAHATELQVMNQANAAAKAEKPAKADKKATEAKATKAENAKLDFTPALSYLDRVRAGRDEIQSLNACFRNLCMAYLFIKGLKFNDFATYMNYRYKGKHNAKKGWSAWYAAQYAESYILKAANDPKSIDHAAARNYLVAQKLQRDELGLRDI